ncbi:hypothetical protein MNBD_GAMMA06-1132 [hydrothermal vent metagenome]|uniref:M23ase beta-sheet core domain-containing protein n=1 Tax=hydrothermal vent metagenome TaxID=652676 RepID=A0A3B0XA56_9ZZZZ
MHSKYKAKISIGAPLEGEWKFLRPPGHHPFAFDFVKTDSGHKKIHGKSLFCFLFKKVSSKDYYCWENSIVAPISGKIFRIGNGWQDHEYTNLWNTLKIWYNATYRWRPKKNGSLDIRPNVGNYIMIKADAGYIVFLAHIRNNSITVTPGHRVERGERLGLIGNSGNSTAPHLHINLFDQMEDPFTSKVLPFVFASFQTYTSQNQWISDTDSVPKVGAVVKF